MPPPPTANRVLAHMLDRLFASLISGPSLNCRPHNSRQRLDLMQVARFKDLSPARILEMLLGEKRGVKIVPRVPSPRQPVVVLEDGDEQLSDQEKAAQTAWREQEGVINKLRSLIEDGRVYAQDTGVHVLNVGFPLLSLPPGTLGGAGSRRILAPVAFIPVEVTIKQGAARAVEICCRGDGADLVTPNIALFAWLEQLTGNPPPELFIDEKGEDPWQEIRELIAYAARLVDIPVPPFAPALNEHLPDTFELRSAPRADEDDNKTILPAAVLGLFPVANQGLLQDMQALVAGEPITGPLESFISLTSLMEDEPAGHSGAAGEESLAPPVKRVRTFASERMVIGADPCQSRAVRLAQATRGLVIHGPPGTGKSQTITNIIGDHLARGERVLMVCDKRGALDVVYNRLRTLQLSNLVAVVHDPQRDQRDLYKAIRQQLDDLPDLQTDAEAGSQLAKIDAELQRLHTELTDYASALGETDPSTGRTFHDLVGAWLGVQAPPGLGLSEQALAITRLEELEGRVHDLQDIFERAAAVGWPQNPWRQVAGMSLDDFLARPMADHRTSVTRLVELAKAADAAADSSISPFAAEHSLEDQGRLREELAGALAPWCQDRDLGILTRWLNKQPPDARAAKEKIDEAGKNLQIFRSASLAPDLAVRLPSPLTSRQQVAEQWKLLGDYTSAYAQWASLFERVRQRAPQAPVPVITQWLGADLQLVARAKKKIEDFQPLVDAIAASTMDRQLFLLFERQPVDSRKLVEWLNLLNEYLESCGKWYRFLTPVSKNRVRPVLAFFGLPVNAQSATNVRTFVTQLRARLDLHADLENGILQTPLAGLAPDDQLLSEAAAHRAVVTAVQELRGAAGTPSGGTASDAEVAGVAPEIVHPFLKPQVDAASSVLSAFGLFPTLADAKRLRGFLGALHARLVLSQIYQQSLGGAHPGVLVPDSELERAFVGHADALDTLLWLHQHVSIANLVEPLTWVAKDQGQLQVFVDGLRKSQARASAISALTAAVNEAGLFERPWSLELLHRLCQGQRVAEGFEAQAARIEELEGVLRIQRGLEALPRALSLAAAELVDKSAAPEAAQAVLRKRVLSGEIGRRLKIVPALYAVDAQRLKTCFERYRALDDQKRGLAKELILHRWGQRQRMRLLASTGNRLNSVGADLKRRLTLRGERAMRLRQVISNGQATEGGDPLFDLRPVWMASPETVAQLFARKPLFDVVIFDEASQCRLEEALPVLTRAKRVVIAGDPQQLPPTRFFESAMVSSEQEDPETDQELFETQQAGIEDLLGAALNLEIQECYLDVHYRSRNSDLIGFSNDQFYKSRLQPIPGHPSRVARYAPVTLYAAGGTYHKRRNEKEADKVVAIVHDLLRRAEPPSIGVACFNTTQRDLIIEKLDDLAASDAAFATKLAAARVREGTGSFEGLFVKNLENVQGDERDHMIISTTYGPDPSGRFFKRFGPLGMAGGGRRLNVLVTRARDEVHVVSSIPPAVYRGVPAVPPGQTPGGGWLLFSYLAYAEQLAAEYQAQHQELAEGGSGAQPRVSVRETKYPSSLSGALGKHLAEHRRQGSDVHWGNDGFCVDLALHHPRQKDDVTIGVLCDMSRFALAEDLVEWDMFRTQVLEQGGWTFRRVWSPHLFRDVQGHVDGVAATAEEYLRRNNETDSLGLDLTNR